MININQLPACCIDTLVGNLRVHTSFSTHLSPCLPLSLSLSVNSIFICTRVVCLFIGVCAKHTVSLENDASLLSDGGCC